MKTSMGLLLAAVCFFVCSPFAYADGTVEDSFDTFNDHGWQTIPSANNAYRLGVFDDGSTGDCVSGGCILADGSTGGLGGGGFTTYMHLQMGAGVPNGAYTIWVKAESGFRPVWANIGLCTDQSTDCNGSNVLTRFNIAPNDGVWRQYYVAWRQGVSDVESCVLEGIVDNSHCVWSDSGLPNGTQFNGVLLTSNVARSDLGDHVWFDELRPASVATAAPACTTDCNDNVLFLPGIEASRLYRPDGSGGEIKLWEPPNDATAEDLAMDTSGSSIRSDVYTRDIVDTGYVPEFGNVYKSFIDDMNGLVSSGKIAAWEPLPYDWRYSLDQILNSGKVIDSQGDVSYSQATSSPYILQEVKRLAGSSRTGKVTLIAHSNGGLVAKVLMVALGPDASKYVDRIILVDVPQVGTPEALGGMLNGLHQGMAIPILTTPRVKLSPQEARALGDTMPGLYALLPSSAYFTYVDDPVATFDTATMPDWVAAYGGTIHSADRQRAFVADTSGIRGIPPEGDLNDPTTLNDSFVTAAAAAHTQIDAWTPSQEVKVIQIAGWGIPTTIKGVSYSRGTVTNASGQTVTVTKPDAQFTVDGDGTVVVPSQLWMSTSTGAEDYFVDLDQYNKLLHKLSSGDLKSREHGDILEINDLLKFINDSLTNTFNDLSVYNFLSKDSPLSTGIRLRYALHSPLTFDLYDSQGRHTGISTSTGQAEEQIPGTYYTELGDVKYVFTDTDTPVRIVMNGYATSTFTLNVEQLQGDTVTASTTWQDMPVTPDTIVSLAATSTIDTLSSLNIDVNGDGRTDFVTAPKLDGVVASATPAQLPLTVMADDEQVLLGGTIPLLTVTLSGFVQGDTASSSTTGKPACSTAASTKAVGQYPITCAVGTLASANYYFANFVPGTLAVAYDFDGFYLSGHIYRAHKDRLRLRGKVKKFLDDPYDPRNPPPIFKAGDTIAISFNLQDANGKKVQVGYAPQWLAPLRGSSIKTTPVFGDDSTTTEAAFKLDGKQYTFDWNTKGLAAGYWYKIYVQLDDGTIYSIQVGLK